MKEGFSTRQDVKADLQLLFFVNIRHFDISSFDHVHDAPIEPCVRQVNVERGMVVIQVLKVIDLVQLMQYIEILIVGI